MNKAEQHRKNQELAARDASLGVGHVWTNVMCPAYRDYDPVNCECLSDATIDPADYA